MNIIYSAGNRAGAEDQLVAFLKNCHGHKIKIAAFAKSSQSIQFVDWLLDPFLDKRSKNNLTKQVLSDVERFQPDLIICDAESIFANIARTLSVKLWYCSPLHLVNGINYQRGQIAYSSVFEDTRRFLNRLPTPDQIFVYSPFGDLQHKPDLKRGFSWIRPYYISVDGEIDPTQVMVYCKDNSRNAVVSELMDGILINHSLHNVYDEEYVKKLITCKWYVTSGQTSSISDAIYNYKLVGTLPDPQEPEETINSIVGSICGVSFDFGRLEYLERYAIGRLEKFFKQFSGNYDLDLSYTETLDNKVNNYAASSF